MKKITLAMVGLAVFFFGFLPGLVLAEEKVTLLFFWGEGCPHCAREKVFLDSLQNKYSYLEIQDYEITSSRENSQYFAQVGQELGVDIAGVPFTVVGREYVTGYMNDEITGRRIEEMVTKAWGSRQGVDESAKSGEVEIPLLGGVALDRLSLPMLTVVVGLLDGFNPCAMWVLLFLISMLLGMRDRRRMWVLGVSFIAASAAVYFLFLAAWLNLFLVLGMVNWIRLAVGVVAIGVGVYQLRDYYVSRGGCQVVGEEKRRRVFERIREVVGEKSLVLAVVGMMTLAVAVNMIELVCSAGLPAIYTHVLSLSNLPIWQYYLLLGLYVLVFMIDDLFVFAIAMISLRVVGMESKYARYSHLIGGGLVLLLGILMIIKPELLMFG